MKKNVPPFRFKKFECSHSRSSMKIGIDAVVLGAWADVDGVQTVLEVGCGCGVISLQIAERLNDTTDRFSITAVDIDSPSIEEAADNFAHSPWSEHLKAEHADFLNIDGSQTGKDTSVKEKAKRLYDLIISNPPYFESGITNPDTARLVARHQGDLSPKSLMEHASGLQEEGGRVALVLPLDQTEATIAAAKDAGYKLRRRTDFRGHPDAPWKRSLLEFVKHTAPEIGENTLPTRENVNDYIACIAEKLTLEDKPGVPSEEHLRLCRRFYLKW